MGGSGGAHSAFAMGLDTSSIVRALTLEEARTLTPGSVVGDTHGGLTFSDDVAAVLEARSLGGWQEIELAPGERWTIIVLNH